MPGTGVGVGAVAHHSFLFLRWSFGDTSFRARRLAESQKVEKHIFDVLSGVQWSKDARNKKNPGPPAFAEEYRIVYLNVLRQQSCFSH